MSSGAKTKLLLTKIINANRPRRWVKILLVVTGVLTLIAPTGFEGDGKATELTENLLLLSIHNGYHSRIGDFAETGGFLDLSEGFWDRRISAANAQGVANEIMTGKSGEGLMLQVTEGSPAWSSGLRSGDIVNKISFPKGCRNRDGLAKRWYDTAFCNSDLLIYRDREPIKLSVEAGSAFGAEKSNVRSYIQGEVPRSIKSHSGLSGGLALSLLYLDRMTEGSLFSSDRVAATGAINVNTGLIIWIGGLPEKAKAAHEAGASILFVPRTQSQEVIKYENMPVFEVLETEDAVEILCSRGADDAICERYK